MAAGTKTAADHFGDLPAAHCAGPVRTCVGCRRKASASELIRVVVSHHNAAGVPVAQVAERRGMPGRGAWLHCDPGCVELAQRRRAFGRALRVTAVDTDAVGEYVTTHLSSSSGTPAGDETT